MPEGFDRDRFEALLALADFRRQLRESRITRQWQASFTAWAAQGALLLQANELPQHVVIGASTGLLFIHIGWLAWHQHRADDDQSRMRYYHDKAAQLVDIRPEPADVPGDRYVPHLDEIPAKRSAWRTFGHKPAVLQFLTTLALAAAVVATALDGSTSYRSDNLVPANVTG